MNARADQMTRIINDLLDITRLEEGRLVGECWLAPIEEIITSVMAEFEQEACRKDIRLSSRVERPLPSLKVDVWRIHQVIENLLSNAIKFTSGGGEAGIAARLLPSRRKWKWRSSIPVRASPQGAGAAVHEVLPAGYQQHPFPPAAWVWVWLSARVSWKHTAATSGWRASWVRAPPSSSPCPCRSRTSALAGEEPPHRRYHLVRLPVLKFRIERQGERLGGGPFRDREVSSR